MIFQPPTLVKRMFVVVIGMANEKFNNKPSIVQALGVLRNASGQIDANKLPFTVGATGKRPRNEEQLGVAGDKAGG